LEEQIIPMYYDNLTPGAKWFKMVCVMYRFSLMPTEWPRSTTSSCTNKFNFLGLLLL
jgi:hypothetical protein